VLIPILRRRHLVALALLALPACSTQDQATLTLSVGGESDALTRAPAPTKLVVDTIDTQTGATTNLATVDLPAGTIDLGNRDPNPVVRVRANGVDATGRVLVTGMSTPLQLGALSGTSFPIFIARTSEFARMPVDLGDSREAPILGSVLGRYVLATGGANLAASTSAASTQIYDLAVLGPYSNPPKLPRTPTSVAAVGSSVLLIDDAGASWFALSDSSSQAAVAPSGGTFAEVSGGSTVVAPDGSMYVVGGTRPVAKPPTPTVRILKVAADGTLSFLSLTTARAGASATWVTGRGVVVAGGSSTGAGVELIDSLSTVATSLGYPPDATVGAGAAGLDGSHVLLGGGVDASGQPAPVRVIDLGCTSSTCTASTWDAAALPVSLGKAQAFDLATDTGLIVGDDGTGLSHAVRVTAKGATEIAFKIPRHGARGIRVNPPAITFVGGAATVESFAP